MIAADANASNLSDRLIAQHFGHVEVDIAIGRHAYSGRPRKDWSSRQSRRSIPLRARSSLHSPKRHLAKRSTSACASMISGISGVGEMPSSVRARERDQGRAGGCPSSDDLRQIAGFRKRGFGSSVIEIMRHAVDAASDGLRFLAFDPSPNRVNSSCGPLWRFSVASLPSLIYVPTPIGRRPQNKACPQSDRARRSKDLCRRRPLNEKGRQKHESFRLTGRSHFCSCFGLPQRTVTSSLRNSTDIAKECTWQEQKSTATGLLARG